MKCQCTDTNNLLHEMLNLYDEKTERPFVDHAPGECLCTNEVRLYKRASTGEILWLCSICNRLGDNPISF